MSTDILTPPPFNLCSNAGSTIYFPNTISGYARALNFFGRPWQGLFWVEPVLLNRCMVLATVLQLSFRVLQSSYSLRYLYVKQQFFFSDLQRVLCHEVPCWTSSDHYVRAITPNLTHLLPIHTWDLVTLTSHMTPGGENCYLGPLTFVASGLDINGCVLSYFERTANVHCYTSCTLTALHCSKV